MAHRHHAVRWRRRGALALHRVLVWSLVVVFASIALVTPALAAQTIGSLPSIDGLALNRLPEDMLIFDRRGDLLADIGSAGDHRIVVPLGQISEDLIDATLAAEDHTFYQNVGIDVGGIVRAALADFAHHSIIQGASTISQQLVKQLFLGPNPPPTLQRKLREAVLAIELNRHYTKSQILELYLNTIYYGNQAYGVEAAARTYFHRTAHDLTLAQSALLAGLPRAPSANNPVLHPAGARLRQAEVLRQMVLEHDITQQQADRALAEPLQIFPPTNTVRAAHFVDYVLGVLARDFHIEPSDRHGYRIQTSLDLNLQQLAERTIHDQIAQKGDLYNFHDAALVSMDPRTGEVLAMVGGNNENRQVGQINMAISATRQSGSAFKIFTYTAAIESRKVNMLAPILDEPLTFPIGAGSDGFAPYSPSNYDRGYHGVLPLKMALGNSMNIPALKVELRIGIPAVLSAARRMGATTLSQDDSHYWWSLTLGAYPVPVLDMATGASTLANMGIRHRPAPILRIADGQGRQVFAYDPTRNAFQAVSPQVAFIMASILSDDRNRCMEFGCHGDLTLPGRQVAAKTGTSQEFRDNWTLGFTPGLTTVVWVGNPDYTPLSHNSTGIVGAAPIWHRFMSQALAGKPDEWYVTPSGLDQLGDNYFLPGTETAGSVLGEPWPRCGFSSYDPYALTYSDMVVDGVPCVINQGGEPIMFP